MKNPLLKVSFALVLVVMSSLACAIPFPSPSPTPTNPPPTATPIPPVDSGQAASVSDIQSVEFLGKQFELQFKKTDQPVQIYEYYLSDESPSKWIELVEFQVYPVNPAGNDPIDFAQRTADAFIQQYPDMQYALFTDNNSEAVLLDFFYPTATLPGYLEFDAFKYFRDPNSDQVICIHYAKNIEDISASRTYDNVLNEIKLTRQEVEAAMAKFELEK